MTRLFGKKNKQTTIAELEEYYANQNQKQSRPLKAWLLAILSLLITIVIIIALFLGGRWLYRTLVDDDNGDLSVTTSDNNGDIVLPSFDGGFEDDASNQENGSVNGSVSGEDDDSSSDTSDSDVALDSDSNTDSSSDSSTSSDSEGVVSDQAASTNVSNEDRLSATGSDEELPNTGAGDLIFVLPVIVAVAGYFTALKRQSK